jgi:hypothetical protein
MQRIGPAEIIAEEDQQDRAEDRLAPQQRPAVPQLLQQQRP